MDNKSVSANVFVEREQWAPQIPSGSHDEPVGRILVKVPGQSCRIRNDLKVQVNKRKAGVGKREPKPLLWDAMQF